MTAAGFDVVTGAYGYTGKYITRRLLSEGRQVRTLTGHPDRPDPFSGAVPAFPFDFDQPAKLARTLEGADTLYNTYWVRFTHGQTSFDQAVNNTRTLLRAAKEAGVRRLVHVSITNPSLSSPLPYFKGKAMLEQDIRESGLSYAILRPTVIFGHEDILINNIAWLLRRFPVFAVPGNGEYSLQPIYVEDMSALAVAAARESANPVVDAVGPEVFTFNALVRLIAKTIGSRARILHVSPTLALQAAQMAGKLTGDVMLTREEVDGLMANLLVSSNPPTGHTALSTWLSDHAGTIGAQYHSELQRHYVSPGSAAR